MSETEESLTQRIDPAAKNVLGQPLDVCGCQPMTGFFRNGCCETNADDLGVHTVCVVASAEFLAYSKGAGNDLSTPRPEYGFFGVKPGDRWCLCAGRWLQAYQAGYACKVVLEATHSNTLKIVPLESLLEHAVTAERAN